MDDMGWIRKIPMNPLTMNQYVLIWFDREVTKNDIDILTEWWHEIYGNDDFNDYVYLVKRGGYIRFDMDWDNDVYDFNYGSSRRTLSNVDNTDKYNQYNLSELIPLNVNESENNEWDWAINIQPIELQDPRSWIGKHFGYGQSVIDDMYRYEIQRGDDKASFEIIDVMDDNLIILRHDPVYGVGGVRTNISIQLFITQINKGYWVWL